MSEPLSSTEIEDVLSSIRRLVSEDLRPIHRAAPASVAADGKLILTPALRVVQDDDMGQTASQTDAAPMFIATPRVILSDPLPTQRPVDVAEAPIAPEPSALEMVVASVGAGVNAQPEDWEAEVGDIDMASDLDPIAWDMPGHEDEAEAPFLDAIDDDAEQDFAPVAQLEHDHFELHATNADQEVPGWAQHDEEDDHALEGAAEVVHGTIEPDPVWADAAEASVIAALAAENNHDQQEDLRADTSDEGADGMRFDEEVLRELVRDILREELAGRMGERITRNIRKLVRTEIARALAAQDFE